MGLPSIETLTPKLVPYKKHTQPQKILPLEKYV